MNIAKNKLIILDRDGVINEDSDAYIKTPEEWLPVPGSIDAIARLSQAGYRVAVATNQSGIGRGYFDEYTLAAMHDKMHELVEEAGGHIDAVCYCPHLPEAGCHCRKPDTGLLEEIEENLQLALQGAWYVGDSEKDLDCALARGCQPVLVLSGKGRRTLSALDPAKREQVLVFDDLARAVDQLLEDGAA